MIDREKIIKALECCSNDKPFYHAHCDKCPYNGRNPDNMGGCIKLYRDAMELLKEQEPVRFKVTRQDKSYPFWDSVCTGCGYKTSTVNVHWKYCPICGKKVKWDATD